MRLVFPNSHRINRGNYVVKDLAEACRANDVTDLVILHEHRGIPDAMIVSHFPHGPTLYFTLHNVSLRHDIASYRASTVSEQYPHLILENFSSPLGERVRDCLKYLFPVPKEDAKRVMTFSNEHDFISFRHHVFVKVPPRDVQLAEVGPRFEMKRTLKSSLHYSLAAYISLQHMKSDRVLLSRRKPSVNGCSRTTHARPRNAACSPALRRGNRRLEQTMMTQTDPRKGQSARSDEVPY